MRTILLATALATAYALLRGWPEALHPLLRSCLAVLILVLGVALWRRKRRHPAPRATAARPARWPDYLAMGLGLLAVECLFLFFLTAAPPRAEALALTLEETLRPEAAAARQAALAGQLSDTASRGSSGNWLWDSLGRRPLPQRTNAQPGNKPEVFFQAADRATADALRRGRPYLTAFALEIYDDAVWSPQPIAPLALTADPTGPIRFPQPPARPGPLLHGTLFHSANETGQDVLTTLQGPVEVALPRLRRISPGIVRLLPLPNPSSGYEYRSTARPLDFDQLLTASNSTTLRPAPPPFPSLLALPDDPALRTGLQQIVDRTDGPLLERLLALRSFLREHCRYSLEVTNEEQRDPIDNFLFHERRGHCEFFATAGALLCRALGVPSRIAYGWSGGRYFPGQDLFMFRAREAHAWTEIYLEDLGWVVFDCTPPGALDSANPSVAPPDEQPPLDEDGRIVEETPTATTTAASDRNHWIALAAGLALLPLAAGLLRLRKHPRPGPLPGTTLLLPDPPHYLTRFKQACQRLGHPMPPGRTLRQHLQSLAHHDLHPPFANDLLDYHYATTYGPTPPDRTREKHLTKRIAAW